MAGTKQTAKKSTGGAPPKKPLARMAARKPAAPTQTTTYDPEYPMKGDKLSGKQLVSVSFVADTNRKYARYGGRFRVKTARKRPEMVYGRRFRKLFKGLPLADYLEDRPGQTISLNRAWKLGLTEDRDEDGEKEGALVTLKRVAMAVGPESRSSTDNSGDEAPGDIDTGDNEAESPADSRSDNDDDADDSPSPDSSGNRRKTAGSAPTAQDDNEQEPSPKNDAAGGGDDALSPDSLRGSRDASGEKTTQMDKGGGKPSPAPCRVARVIGGMSGVIYGSEEGADGSLDIDYGKTEQGGPSWFRINFHTVEIWYPGEAPEDENLLPYEVCESKTHGDVVKVTGGDPLKSQDMAFNWLDDHPGRVLMLWKTGARPSSQRAGEHLERSVTVPFQSSRGNCLALSLLNAAVLVKGIGGRQYCRAKLSGTFKDLFAHTTVAGVANYLQSNMKSMALEHIKNPDGTSIRSDRLSIQYVLDLPPGVYLVRLFGLMNKQDGEEGEDEKDDDDGKGKDGNDVDDDSEDDDNSSDDDQMNDGEDCLEDEYDDGEGKDDGGDDNQLPIDHTVVVDATTRLIWDSSEENPMRLSEMALNCCVGDKVTLTDVLEVRPLVLIGRKKPNTELNKEKKRRRREAQSARKRSKRKIVAGSAGDRASL